MNNCLSNRHVSTPLSASNNGSTLSNIRSTSPLELEISCNAAASISAGCGICSADATPMACNIVTASWFASGTGSQSISKMPPGKWR